MNRKKQLLCLISAKCERLRTQELKKVRDFLKKFGKEGEIKMNKETKYIQVTQLPRIEDIKQVYSGHPGCTCGCQGNYYEDERNKKRILKLFFNNFENVYTYKGCETEYLCLDISENRTYIIYLIKNEVKFTKHEEEKK